MIVADMLVTQLNGESLAEHLYRDKIGGKLGDSLPSTCKTDLYPSLLEYVVKCALILSDGPHKHALRTVLPPE